MGAVVLADSSSHSAERTSLRERAEPGRGLRTARRWSLWLVFVAVLAFGVATRAWLFSHAAINADEAIVGEMVIAAHHGHFTTFYWGQSYGGFEPYVVWALSYVFGQTWLVLALTPVALAAVAAVLVAFIVRRLTGDRWTAAFAGLLAWAWPQADLISSTHEWGFRGTTICCGLATVLLSLRIHHGSRAATDFAFLGLFAGLGWWSSPEVVFMLVPAVLILGSAAFPVVRRRLPPSRTPGGGAGRWAGRTALCAGAGVVGAAPWLYSNARSHLASLRTTGAGGNGSTYRERVVTFFARDLPMQTGATRIGGAWVGGDTGRALFVVVLVGLVAAAACCVLRRDVAAAFVAALAAFPFVLAFNPESWYWRDGRLSTEFQPLVAIVAGVGAFEAARRGRAAWAAWAAGARRGAAGARRGAAASVAPLPLPPAPTLHGPPGRRLAHGLMAVTLVVGAAVTGKALSDQVGSSMFTASGFVRHWGPEAQVETSLRLLERHRVVDGYGEYWVAYVLDYVSGNAVHIASVGHDRWPAVLATVEAVRDPAWLFYAPDAYALAHAQAAFPGSVGGPAGWSLARFTSVLGARRIAFRVVGAGVLDAVVPAQKVTPADMGMVV